MFWCAVIRSGQLTERPSEHYDRPENPLPTTAHGQAAKPSQPNIGDTRPHAMTYRETARPVTTRHDASRLNRNPHESALHTHTHDRVHRPCDPHHGRSVPMNRGRLEGVLPACPPACLHACVRACVLPVWIDWRERERRCCKRLEVSRARGQITMCNVASAGAPTMRPTCLSDWACAECSMWNRLGE